MAERRAAQRRPRQRAASREDGRVRRGARNREAIVVALYALVGAGELAPTAERIAARAGVGLRSVFRHFADLESLYAELDARLRAEVEPLAAAPVPRGSASQRAAALVAQRATLFERIAPYKRSGELQRRRSPFLTAQHRGLVRMLRAQLGRWLPEVARVPSATREAMELVTSFEAWERLRSDQGLSPARARAALEAALVALLRAPGH